MTIRAAILGLLVSPLLLPEIPLRAGPYSTALSNGTAGAIDAGVPGFVGPDGEGRQPRIIDYDEDLQPVYANSNNYVNPAFVGWATGVAHYAPSTIEISPAFSNPAKALGPVTGDHFDIVSLGDLTAAEIAAGASPGRITLTFDYSIRNGAGADFVVFENGFISLGGAGVAGQIFAELAFVEVSTNGTDFARFPSLSLTANPVGDYGTVDASDIYNLAGKHVNSYTSGESWGTPFDLETLLLDPGNLSLVATGLLDLNAINFVRIIDIPGDGSATDSAGNPVYDAWHTLGSGGFDLEAIGVLNNSLNTPIPEPSAFALLLSASALAAIALRRNPRRG